MPPQAQLFPLALTASRMPWSPLTRSFKHLSQQRKRHYWRLDCKCITLFQNNTTSRYYKVGLLAPSSLRLSLFATTLSISLLVSPAKCPESYPVRTQCLFAPSRSASATPPVCLIPASPLSNRRTQSALTLCISRLLLEKASKNSPPLRAVARIWR